MNLNQADGANSGALSSAKYKFVGGQAPAVPPAARERKAVPLPVHIREAADRLGLALAESLTRDAVHRAWRKQICMPEHHPDLGGNAEKAILLNTAKDQLSRWLDTNEPKLAKFLKPD
jgi:hypothetical protein